MATPEPKWAKGKVASPVTLVDPDTGEPYVAGASAGGATEAAQDEQTALLTTIDADTSGIATSAATIAGAVKAEDAAASSGDSGVYVLAVRTDSPAGAAANGDYHSFTVDSLGKVWTAGAYSADQAAGSTDRGLSVLAIRDDALSAITPVEGDYAPMRVDANGALWVTSSGAIAVTQSGTWNVGTVTTVTTVTTVGAVTAITNALPAGNNNIGDVDIASIAAGDNNIGNVDIVTQDGVAAEASALGNGILIQGDDGTDRQNIQVEANTGNLRVQIQGSASSTAAETVANGGDTMSNSLNSLVVTAETYVFNGSDWDRVRGDITNGMDVDVTRLPALVASSANIGDVDILTIAAGDNNIGNVDIVTLPALAAGTNYVGQVATPMQFITVDMTAETTALDVGDIAATTQVVTNATRVADAQAILQTLTLIDVDDQKAKLRVVFFSANTSLGTEDAAPDIDDTEAQTLIGWVDIAVADYVDFGANSAVHKTNIGMVVQPASGTRDIYMGIYTPDTSTPTYAGGHIYVRLGFM